ncbi:MAG: hypothetical protein MUC83_15055 [Pirellula sp.]|nr:hypothetical protein [Pirellula sp.]
MLLFPKFAIRYSFIVMGLAACLPSNLQAQSMGLADLLTTTPERANAVLYVDGPTVRNFVEGTPLHQDLPESLNDIKIVADLDLKAFSPNWEIGYLTLNKSTDATVLANTTGGYVDSIANRSVVWTPNSSYLIPMGEEVVGLVRPADRKLVSRWLKKEKSSASAFLTKHALQSSQFFAVLLAVDLEDEWSPIAIQDKISEFASLKTANANQVVALLSSIRGIRVVVSKKNLDDCIISIEFAKSPEVLLPVAKDFFVEILDRNQSSIPEASSWIPSVDGNSLAFRGKISPATLDDLLGIFTAQQLQERLSTSVPESGNSSSNTQAGLTASKNYFKKVTDVIDRVRNYSAHGTGDRAQWNARLANRIDELPTLNVDSDLIDFGARVSSGLRGNVVAMQTANVTAGTAQVVNGSGYGYGNYNYSSGYNFDVNSPAKYRATAQGVGNISFRELISSIDQMVGDIRREMTDKYQVQF